VAAIIFFFNWNPPCFNCCRSWEHSLSPGWFSSTKHSISRLLKNKGAVAVNIAGVLSALHDSVINWKSSMTGISINTDALSSGMARFQGFFPFLWERWYLEAFGKFWVVISFLIWWWSTGDCKNCNTRPWQVHLATLLRPVTTPSVGTKPHMASYLCVPVNMITKRMWS